MEELEQHCPNITPLEFYRVLENYLDTPVFKAKSSPSKSNKRKEDANAPPLPKTTDENNKRESIETHLH